MRRSTLLSVALVATIALAACGHKDQQVVQQQPQVVQQAPQVVQQQPQYVDQQPQQVVVQQQPQVVYAQPPVVVQAAPVYHSDLGTGILLGAMMSGGGRDVHHYHYAPAPIVHQTTVINRTYVRPSAPAYNAPSVTRSVTTTSTYRRR